LARRVTAFSFNGWPTFRVRGAVRRVLLNPMISDDRLVRANNLDGGYDEQLQRGKYNLPKHGRRCYRENQERSVCGIRQQEEHRRQGE